MADQPRPKAEAAQPHAPGDRLESWKDIAAYLRRDVRTVQRWEQTEGVPVHRLQRAHRPIPYAYKTELDGWWASRTDNGPSSHDGSPTPSMGIRVAHVRAVGVAAVIIGVALIVVYGMSRGPSHALAASARVPVVTTQSVTALKLFTQADALWDNGSMRDAETLLREAIAVDPSFASAHIMLAWAVRNQNRPAAEFLPIAARAEQFGTAATESERLFIRGSSLRLRGEETEACAIFEALVKIQPDHNWAISNLSDCVQRDPYQVAELWAKLADLQPNDLDRNVFAGWANDFLISNPARAAVYLKRAERLQRAGAPDPMWLDSWLRLLPAYRKWLADDLDGTLSALTATVTNDAPRLETSPRIKLYLDAGVFMIALGRVRDAEHLYNNQLLHYGTRHGYLALVDYVRGDMEGARKHQALYTSSGVIATIICARLGLVESARARLVEGRTMAGPSFLTIQGELAFHDGDSDRAIELLTAATRQPYGQPQYFFATETLAHALLGSGRLAEAITTLEVAAAERRRSYDPAYGGPLAGYAWLRVRLLQAELYARASRIADSRRVAAEIARLLAKADSDFPILQRAQQLLTNQSLTAPGDAYEPTTRD